MVWNLLVYLFVSPAPGTVPDPRGVFLNNSHSVFILCKTDDLTVSHLVPG